MRRPSTVVVPVEDGSHARLEKYVFQLGPARGAELSEGEGQDMSEEKSRNGQIDETDIERLRKEHRELDEAITKIEAQLYRSVADQTEIRRLKKLKLAKKDAIYQLERRRATA